jgi:MFS family permease
MGSVEDKIQMASVREAGTQLPRYRWVVLALLLAAFTSTYVDRLNWTIAMPAAVSELGWGMAQGGALVSGFYAGYVITQVPGGALADRYGSQRILAIAVASMGFFAILTPLIPTFWGMLLLRFISGIGAGPIFACGVKYQSQWFPRGERATAMSIFTLGASIGNLVVNGALPTLVMRTNWRYAFTIPGVVTLAVACLILVGAPSKPHRGLSASSAAQAQASSGQQKPFDVRTFTAACVADFLRTGPALGFATWTLTYLVKDRGFSTISAGAIMSAYSIATILGSLSSGFISDRLALGLGSRRAISFGALICSTSSITLLALSDRRDFWSMIAMLVLCGLTHGMVSPPLNTLVSELLAGKTREGRLLGLYNMSGQCGPLVFPVLLGWVLDRTGSFRLLYLTTAGSRLLAALAVSAMRESA